MFGLTSSELKLLQRLTTPAKIQDFLTRLPINHEKKGDTCRSPRMALREGKAHCIEAAFIAAVALWLRGEKPLLLDLRTVAYDDDHVLALYRKNGYWGAIAKTNHAPLRFRDPVYRTVRELAMSYFHEYFLIKNGEKTLVSYSRPMNLARFGTAWITSETELWPIAIALDEMEHFPFVPKKNRRFIRRADKIERLASKLAEWIEEDPRT